MPRRSRIIAPGLPLHVIQRGNNRQACFFADGDYSLYLELLQEYARREGCAIHAYVLMTNHIHLLLTPQRRDSAGNLMKRVGQRYVQHVNRRYDRSGTLWQGRYRSCIIQQDEYLFSCQRYIELNPVRAKMVRNPGEYRWSSYRVNGEGEVSDVITPHDLYLGLAGTDEERQAAYREMFDLSPVPDDIEKLRKATNGNFALGTEKFCRKLSETIGCRVSPRKAGRPKTQTQKVD